MGWWGSGGQGAAGGGHGAETGGLGPFLMQAYPLGLLNPVRYSRKCLSMRLPAAHCWTVSACRLPAQASSGVPSKMRERQRWFRILFSFFSIFDVRAAL